MKLFTKKIEIPVSNETKIVDAVQLWEVRWTSYDSRSCYYLSLCERKPEVEAFATKQEAENFAESLINALRLVRYQGSLFNDVRIVKGRSYEPQLRSVESA